MSKLITLLMPVVLFVGVVSCTQEPSVASTDNGLITVDGAQTVEETSANLQEALKGAGFVVPAVIDHSANAARIGKELRANKLIIFGNPEVGTNLMQSVQTVGIDLPLKFLIWEDNGGQVDITYNSPQYLAERHGIEGQDELISNISNALSRLAGSAAAK